MRALVQRVREGSVAIGGQTMARIGKGYVILLGIRQGTAGKPLCFWLRNALISACSKTSTER